MTAETENTSKGLGLAHSLSTRTLLDGVSVTANDDDDPGSSFNLPALHDSIIYYLEELTRFERWFETTIENIEQEAAMVTVYEHYVEHLPPDSKHRPHSVLLLSYIYCRLAIEVRQAVGLDFKDDLSYVLGASPVKLVKPLIQLLEFIAWELLKASDSRPVPQMVQHQQFFRRMQNKDLSSILNLFSSWDNLEAAASLKVHVSSASKPGDEGDPRYHIQESYACKYEALKAVAKARNLGALGNHYLHSCCHLVLRGENHPYPSSIVARYLDVIYQSVWTLFHKEFSKAQCYLRALNEIIANKKNKATAAELNKDTEIIDTLEELVTLFQNTDEKYDNLLLKCSSDIHKGCHFVVEKVKYTCGCKRPLHFEKHCKGN